MHADATTLSVFAAIIAATLAITFWAARKNNDTADHYVAGGQLKGWQNGLALTGDYLSASAFLGIAGAIALQGISAIYLAICGVMAFLFMLLIVAEPLRNLGRYTMADVYASRFSSTGLRSAAALSTLVVSGMYMIGQLVGAGLILNLLIGVPYWISVVVVGLLMGFYIAVGGMRGATWIQIVKAVLLLIGIAILVVLVLARFGMNPMAFLEAVTAQVDTQALVPQGGLLEGLNWVSICVAVTFSLAGLPHILMRFFTVPTAKEARRSVTVAIWTVGIALFFMPVVGYGAALFVGRDEITAASGGGNLAAPQLAQVLGGPILFAFISAVAFATILAVVSGLCIAASSAFAHDFYTHVLRKGEATEKEQMRVARLTAVAVSIVAIVLSLGAQNSNISILVTLAQAVAASANLPVILFALFWRRFNTFGAIGGTINGLAITVILVVLGPTVMGDGALFPMSNPALVTVPLGFLGCYVATLIGERRRSRNDLVIDDSYDDVMVARTVGRVDA